MRSEWPDADLRCRPGGPLVRRDLSGRPRGRCQCGHDRAFRFLLVVPCLIIWRVLRLLLCSPIALPHCVLCEPWSSSASIARCWLVWRALSPSPLTAPARCVQAGMTLITAAAFNGHLDVVTSLADHGADVNAADEVRCVSSLACLLCAFCDFDVSPLLTRHLATLYPL